MKTGNQESSAGRIFNFSAGPAVLPLEVLEQARDEMINHQSSGMSVMEMSHRSPEFEAIAARAESGVRRHLQAGDDYEVLFLQGGASLQFAMVPMNLALPGQPIDLINTGVWTQKARDEAAKITAVNIAATTESENFRRLPRLDEIRLDPKASYVHLCSNNTIAGTEWSIFPETGTVPIVADMSSNILSRPVDVKRFGLIFAGAQKNIGPSGVTLVVVRKDLVERAGKNLPVILQYRTHAKEKSLYNTPPTYGIYMIALVMEWMDRQGGLEAVEKKNLEKAALLYEAIDNGGFYYSPVEKKDRSRMNVVFRIRNQDENLEKKFAAEAAAEGLSGLKGHRLVGGLRASIYNAQPLEGVKALVEFMREFARKNG
ncbi:MAG: 3-phosphoserine/phosphohydroxythreonine transaminase [Candidatus Omnitrophica bacterium]|nr:3-phosphoserine/phosphohydroxythreonine transaminase [Candidatus Omnitrophota bacterium]